MYLVLEIWSKLEHQLNQFKSKKYGATRHNVNAKVTCSIFCLLVSKMSEKRIKLPVKKFHKTFDKDGVPFCLKWSVEDVANWVEQELKFPQYKVNYYMVEFFISTLLSYLFCLKL